MSEWQPIETVPKDGTEVDLWGTRADGTAERWCNARWTGDGVGAGWWGPWTDGFECGIPGRNSLTLTHWMPVPRPPENNMPVSLQLPEGEMQFYAGDYKRILTMHSDGRITLGHFAKPDEAVNEFLLVLAELYPHWLRAPSSAEQK